uniref:Reverse transcriptase domain-containing protein n=1 Tax=Cacopsylla melanoneura TaxID=428564 RepID=A0A8D8W392_9HEMI
MFLSKIKRVGGDCKRMVWLRVVYLHLFSTTSTLYSNDQPVVANTRQFRYADDSAVATQADTFEQVSNTLTTSLESLSTYFLENYLQPNPRKTQVCSFHLKNREANSELDNTWQGERQN